MAELLYNKETNIFLLRTKYKEKLLAKAIPGSKWDFNLKGWCFPANRDTQTALAINFPFDVPPSYLPLATDEEKEAMRQKISEMEAQEPSLAKYNDIAKKDMYFPVDEQSVKESSATDADISIEGLGGQLMPFQRAGVAYAMKHKRCWIADEMGLGKTVQALASVQACNAYPSLIIVPAVVKINWRNEAEKWLKGKSLYVIKNGKDDFKEKAEDADVVIITYDMVKKFRKDIRTKPFLSIVLDESHYIKTPKSQRTKAVLDIAKTIPYRFLLSGTPLLNNPSELVSQLTLLGRLDYLGGWNFFVSRYCNAKRTKFGWDYTGSANLKELNQRLRSSCYIRRNKKDVLKDLPEKVHTNVFLQISPKVMAKYKKAKDSLFEYYTEFTDRPLEDIIKSCNNEDLVRIEVLKQIACEGKIDGAIEWVKNFLESGEKLVLFATHITTLERLKSEFPEDETIFISGATPPEMRQAEVERFQTDPNVKLAILGLKAANVGITLTEASNVAFLELAWTPADMQQAEDRCHRIGQVNSVNVYYLLAEDTIDKDIALLIDQKNMVMTAAADGKIMDAETSILRDIMEALLIDAGNNGLLDGFSKEDAKALTYSPRLKAGDSGMLTNAADKSQSYAFSPNG